MLENPLSGKQERVIIHAVAGGVGTAAVSEIGKWVGVEKRKKVRTRPHRKEGREKTVREFEGTRSGKHGIKL